MSEQLALQQRFRDRRTVDRNERFLVAITDRVNRTCRQLFTGTRLTADENRDVTLSGKPQSSKDFLHRSTATDEPLKGVALLRLFFEQRDLLVGQHKVREISEATNGSGNRPVVLGNHPHVAVNVEFPAAFREQLALLTADAIDHLRVGLIEHILDRSEAFAVLTFENTAGLPDHL